MHERTRTPFDDTVHTLLYVIGLCDAAFADDDHLGHTLNIRHTEQRQHILCCLAAVTSRQAARPTNHHGTIVGIVVDVFVVVFVFGGSLQLRGPHTQMRIEVFVRRVLSAYTASTTHYANTHTPHIPLHPSRSGHGCCCCCCCCLFLCCLCHCRPPRARAFKSKASTRRCHRCRCRRRFRSSHTARVRFARDLYAQPIYII